MKSSLRLLIVMALWTATAAIGRSQQRDPADLLPAKTLAYVEVQQPQQLSKEIAGLIKGSALENMPRTMAKFRADHPTPQFWMLQEVAMFSLFLSPETIAEAGRLQGGAI